MIELDQNLDPDVKRAADVLKEMGVVPVLVFTGPTDETVTIPKGLLTCCRVEHQIGCAHHVARSLVGAETLRRYPDGRAEEWIHPHPVDMEGDILAQPSKLSAAVKAHWMLSLETAKRLGAGVESMQVAVFCLDLATAARYDEATRASRLAARKVTLDGVMLDPAVLEAMPVEYLPTPDPDDEDADGEDGKGGALLATMLGEGFVPAEMYADRVMIYPGEIGHNGTARYVAGAVWPAPEKEAMPWQTDPDPFEAVKPSSP